MLADSPRRSTVDPLLAVAHHRIVWARLVEVETVSAVEHVAPLERALSLAAPEGYVRIFVDEGLPMAGLLSEAAANGIMPGYTARLLAAFEAEEHESEDESYLPPALPAQSLVEPLSGRELEVLQLIAQGLSNREISERLFLAMDTVKGHNRRIFAKLMVQRRTEAVAKAKSLDILPHRN